MKIKSTTSMNSILTAHPMNSFSSKTSYSSALLLMNPTYDVFLCLTFLYSPIINFYYLHSCAFSQECVKFNYSFVASAVLLNVAERKIHGRRFVDVM